jgi:predicted glycoside hydrolase/deacetylase ChbG (UPF0249 family)
MTPKSFAVTFALTFCLVVAGRGESSPPAASAPRLIIRTDDIGFCHGVNMAFQRIAEQGMVTSASVIVNTPWLDEAVEILKQHPEISVGVHLALNSEWKVFKWGPVTPYDRVPSLVDAFGKFYGSRKELFSHRPKLREVARELRAQIELAKRKGLNISYIDNHMSAAISTLEFQQEMERLAREYHIGISRYINERELPNVYDVPPERKLAQALQNLNTITNGALYLLVCHVGTDGPEMQALTDLNVIGPKNMSKHRQAEADVLCSAEYKAAVQARGIRLVGYRELLLQARMERPFVSEPYERVVRAAVGK